MGQRTIQTLIRLAVDIHNDSVTKTLSTCSWHTRYLAQKHSDNQVAQCIDHGLRVNFAPFLTTPADLHYLSPDVYSEMVKNISTWRL